MDDVKLAATDYPIHDLLRHRWSPRAFADRPVPADALMSLLEAARWTPSSFNEQPWRFVIAARGEDGFAQLLKCLSATNQKWAGRSPLLGLSVAKLTFGPGGAPNRHALYDVGAAMANLTLQATSLGLAVHQMAGFDVEAARGACAIPDGHEPGAAFVIGYPGGADARDTLDEAQRVREVAPRTRNPIAAFAFRSAWGRPL